MKLSDERIVEIYAAHRCSASLSVARAIESEAYRAGELAMRERAAKAADYDCDDVGARAIRALPIEGVE